MTAALTSSSFSKKLFYFLCMIGYALPLPYLLLFVHHSSASSLMWISFTLRDFFLALGILIYPLCQYLGLVLLSDSVSHFGPQRLLRFSAFGKAAGDLLVAGAIFQSHLPLFFCGRALSGFFSSNAANLIDDMETKSLPKDQLKWGFLLVFGIVCGPALSGLLFFLPLSLLSCAAASFILVAVVEFFLAFCFKQPLAHSTESQKIKAREEKAAISSFITALQTKSSRLVIFLFLFIQIGFSFFFLATISSLSIHLESYAQEIGLFSLSLCLVLGLVFLLSRFKREHSSSGILMTLLIFQAILLILYSFCPSPWCTWFFSLLIIGCIGYCYILCPSLFSDLIVLKGQAGGFSIASSAFAWNLAGFLIGLHRFFGLPFLLFSAGLAFLLAAATYFSYLREQNKI